MNIPRNPLVSLKVSAAVMDCVTSLFNSLIFVDHLCSHKRRSFSTSSFESLCATSGSCLTFFVLLFFGCSSDSSSPFLSLTSSSSFAFESPLDAASFEFARPFFPPPPLVFAAFVLPFATTAVDDAGRTRTPENADIPEAMFLSRETGSSRLYLHLTNNLGL